MEPIDWIERYEIRSDRNGFGGWAIVHIDSKGFLGVVSDFGNYAYHWSSFGGDFKKFLSEVDADYLYGKLTHTQKVYDGPTTLESIRNELKGRLDSGDLSDEQFDEETVLLHGLEVDDNVCGFRDWLRETSLSDAYHLELGQYRPDAQCQTFCEKIWPKFIALLKEGQHVPLRSQA